MVARCLKEGKRRYFELKKHLGLVGVWGVKIGLFCLLSRENVQPGDGRAYLLRNT